MHYQARFRLRAGSAFLKGGSSGNTNECAHPSVPKGCRACRIPHATQPGDGAEQYRRLAENWLGDTLAAP